MLGSMEAGTTNRRTSNLKGHFEFSFEAWLTTVVKIPRASTCQEGDLALSPGAQQGCAGHRQYRTGGYSVSRWGSGDAVRSVSGFTVTRNFFNSSEKAGHAHRNSRSRPPYHVPR